MIDFAEIKELFDNNNVHNIICIEFELRPRNIAKYIAAMSNSYNGYIIIGLVKNELEYSVNGIGSTFNFTNIMNESFKYLSTKVTVEFGLVDYNEKNIFVIKVSKSEIPIYIESELYKWSNGEVLKVEGVTFMDMTKVFIVHGHDNEAKQEVARFVERIGLEAIILHERVSKGKTIIEKIEENTNVGFAIVLYTPCDLGKSKKEDELKNRSRQNVIFEHGYLIGKLKRDRVAAIVKGDIEKPNDISGVVYIDMDSAGAWKIALSKEMKSAGYDIDMNRIF